MEEKGIQEAGQWQGRHGAVSCPEWSQSSGTSARPAKWEYRQTDTVSWPSDQAAGPQNWIGSDAHRALTISLGR